MTRYLCRAGDAWDILALKLYGDEQYAKELLGANPELCGVTVFLGGEVFNAPNFDVPETGEAMPMKAPWR